MRIRSLLLGALVAIGSGGSGCSNKASESHVVPLAVGETCMVSADQSLVGTSIVSPATDCASNDCLFEPASGSTPAHATCTKECANDTDCASQDGGACSGSLACAVAVLTGPLACTKVCVCHDDLVPGLNVDSNGAVITPEACGSDQSPGSSPADMSR